MTTIDFRRQQAALAAHIRDPIQEPPTGIEARRLAIYRDLFFRNIDGFLGGAFPVLRSLMEAEAWQQLVRRFLVQHRCQTPYFLEISQEFVAWLMASPALPGRPFAAALAHYEWVELALDTLDAEWPVAAEDGDFLAGVPVLSPLAWNLSYPWPVHRIGRDFQPQAESPVHLVVCRNRHEQVRFIEINGMTSALLAGMQAYPDESGSRLLTRLAEQSPALDAAALHAAAPALFETLHQHDIVLGVRPCSWYSP